MEGPNPVHPNRRARADSADKTGVLAFACGSMLHHGRLRLSRLPKLKAAGRTIFVWRLANLAHWAAPCKADQLEPYQQIAQTDLRVVAFGEKPDGEPLIVDHGGGGLWDLVPNESAAKTSDFPRKLGETGIFSKLNPPAPVAGVIPFSVKAPQWLDGAIAERFIRDSPNSDAVYWGSRAFGDDDRVAWPKDSVLTRTLTLEGHGVETQLLPFPRRVAMAGIHLCLERGPDRCRACATAGGSQEARAASRCNRWQAA